MPTRSSMVGPRFPGLARRMCRGVARPVPDCGGASAWSRRASSTAAPAWSAPPQRRLAGRARCARCWTGPTGLPGCGRPRRTRRRTGRVATGSRRQIGQRPVRRPRHRHRRRLRRRRPAARRRWIRRRDRPPVRVAAADGTVPAADGLPGDDRVRGRDRPQYAAHSRSARAPRRWPSWPDGAIGCCAGLRRRGAGLEALAAYAALARARARGDRRRTVRGRRPDHRRPDRGLDGDSPSIADPGSRGRPRSGRRPGRRRPDRLGPPGQTKESR